MNSSYSATKAPPVVLKIFNSLAILIILLSISGWIYWAQHGPEIIESAYRGNSMQMVNKYLAIHRSIDPQHRDLHYFLEKGLPVLPRLFGMMILLQIIALFAVHFGWQRIRAFFSTPTHPVNLAIFRIALFGALFIFADAGTTIRFSQFPEILKAAPPGWDGLLKILPIDQTSATAIVRIFQVSCLLAMVGLFTRVSATLAVVSGIYVLGVPQFFGKIDHYHHLLWFTAILAASRCADVLSVDAWLATRRKNSGEKLQTPQPDVIYSLPLRFVWLLIGIIYFFPGFWKFVIGGLDWALSENMRYLIYTRWLQLNWTPFFHGYDDPIFYKISGLGVIIFELCFIFLLFFPRLRKYAIGAGISFHLMTLLLMRINFWTLLISYLAFFDYEKIYQRLVQKRRSSITAATTEKYGARRFGKRSVVIVGSFLFIVNSLCGFLLIDSWPFAVYPTFASVEEPYTQSITFELETADGNVIETTPWERKTITEYIRTPRILGLTWRVLWTTDPQLRQQRARAMVDLFGKYDPVFRQAHSIQVFESIVSVIPEHWLDAPLRRTQIFQYFHKTP